MTDWTKQTFWFEDESSHRKMAVVMEIEALEILDTGNGLTSANEYAPCKECPHLIPCMNSIWSEGARTCNPSGTCVTLVHTCTDCGCRVFSSPSSSKEVPFECPRWESKKKRTESCRACQEVQDLRSGLFLSTPDKAVALQRTNSLVGVLAGDVRQRLPDAWEHLPKDRENQILMDWRSLLYRAQAQEMTPIGVTQVFLANFSRIPELVDAWVECSIPERKFALRVWEGLVRRSQAGG
jgi:hypothetical protein